MDWVALASRWAHVLSGIALLGGALFLRVVLMPAARSLPDAEHEALRQRLRPRWARMVHACVGLLFLSGCLNFWLRMDAVRPWHAVAGLHVLLGLAALFLASALAGRSAKLQRFRDRPERWLAVNLALATAAVMCASAARFLPARAAEPPAASAVPAAR